MLPLTKMNKYKARISFKLLHISYKLNKIVITHIDSFILRYDVKRVALSRPIYDRDSEVDTKGINYIGAHPTSNASLV